jgi:hypothetical protein
LGIDIIDQGVGLLRGRTWPCLRLRARPIIAGRETNGVAGANY